MNATPTRVAASTRRLPRAERREQIARAAATVFMRGGFDGTSMDDVARRAGVTRLIVYRIFETKDELYRAVLDLAIDDLEVSFDALDPTRAPADHEHTVPGMVLAVARRQPDAFRLLWRHAADEPQFRELVEQFKSVVTGYAIQAFGASISDPLMRRWTAQSVVHHLYESVCLWLDDGDPARDRECSVMIAESIRSMIARWAEIGGARR
jgi:AcrR family transcriptional regulator